MSATNSTPNYGLPQWEATDRPATREDFNSAFSTIDSTMKSVSDSATQDAANITSISNRVTTVENTVSGYDSEISGLDSAVDNLSETVTAHTQTINSLNTSVGQNTTDITSLKGRMNNAESAITTNADNITTLNGNVSANTSAITENAADIQNLENEMAALNINNVAGATNLYNTITGHTTSITNINNSITSINSKDLTQDGQISALNTAIQALQQMFNLNDVSDSTLSGQIGLKLAQNSAGSMYKFYGAWVPGNNPTRSNIPGLFNDASTPVQYKGYDTGLTLNTAPSEAYMVSQAGYIYNTSNHLFYGGVEFAVGTDGKIYLGPRTGEASGYASSGYGWVFEPQFYININLDDDVTD